jgi:histidine triad (HIT) family protein
MNDCVFCQILSGTLPASVVHQDPVVTVLMDIHPINPGHAVVIPNRHAASLADLDGETAGEMIRVAQKVAASLRRSGVPCEGVNLQLADGEAAGQSVFHVHLHVIPRFEGDGYGQRFGPDYPPSPSRSELDQVAERIRTVL